MTEKIVLAVDGGLASEAALGWALERARSVPISLEIASVIEIGWANAPLADYRGMYRKVLDEVAERAHTGSPETAIGTTLLSGNPAHALIAVSRGADLLVIGTNRTGAMVGVVHGTVPLQIAGRARCVAVVVPSGWTAADVRSGIVVGWTDDGTADDALTFAIHEAARLRQTLTIVHAWEVPTILGWDVEPAASRYPEIETAHRDALTRVASETRRLHPDVTVLEHLAASSASVALVSEAQQATLVVVGAHGRSALGGLILGSVSHDVLMNMPAPVAVVPRPTEPIEVLPEILDEYLI